MARPQDDLGTQARRFWHIPWRGWWNIAQRTWQQASDDNLTVLAGGIAFFAFLSLAPLLAAVTLVYGLAASPRDVAAGVTALSGLLPAEAAEIIGGQAATIAATPAPQLGIGLVISLALALYGVTRASGAMIAALNVVYDEIERRSFLRVTALTFVFAAAAVLVGAALLAAVALTGIVGAMALPPTGVMIARAILAGVAGVAAVFLVAASYRYAPCREHPRWHWLPPGAVVALVGIALVTALFGIYAAQVTDFQATYGALASVAAFMMWLYFCALALLLGGELNAEIERQTRIDTTDGPDQPMGARGAEMADQVNPGPVVPHERGRS